MIIHDDHAPEDDRWSEYVRAVADGLEHTPARELTHLVFTDGGAPSPLQRKAMKELMDRHHTPHASGVAIVTANPLIRLILAGMSWLNISGKAFPPDQAERAMAHLGIPAERFPEIWATAKLLRADLGINLTCLPRVQDR